MSSSLKIRFIEGLKYCCTTQSLRSFARKNIALNSYASSDWYIRQQGLLLESVHHFFRGHDRVGLLSGNPGVLQGLLSGDSRLGLKGGRSLEEGLC